MLQFTAAPPRLATPPCQQYQTAYNEKHQAPAKATSFQAEVAEFQDKVNEVITRIPKMRAALALRAQRRRSSSLNTVNTVPPPHTSNEYSDYYAGVAASILYRSPLLSESGLPIYILNAAAFPDSFDIDYDSLLPYVLARLPEEDDLLAGADYEVVFFAGGQPESATSEKKNGPGVGWYLQAYHVLSRATRKRARRLYVVHERSWVRVLIEIFGTMVSPKFRKKIVHLSSLSGLALQVPIEQLLIPPSAYLYDRKVAQDIQAPHCSGRRAFSADDPLPRDYTGLRRLPRVLRETTSFLCQADNLRTEGVFRVPAHKTMLGVLREAYDRKQQFVVWKDRNTVYCQPGVDPSIIAEINHADAYGVHMAASLVKVWYRELNTPIFPERCYEPLRNTFGAVEEEITIRDLVALISPDSTSSVLDFPTRLILTWHLLPLLSMVAGFERANKMSPANLAICFSPALVCGSDPMQDAKVTSVVKRVLQAAIEAWPFGLRDACGIKAEDFFRSLQPPPSATDYEDPLHERPDLQDEDGQVDSHRIVLEDGEVLVARPSLPPRPWSPLKPSFSTSPTSPTGNVPQRKPAPAIPGLPRHPSILDADKPAMTASPISTSAENNTQLASDLKSTERTAFANALNGFVLPKSRDPAFHAHDQKIEQPVRSASDPLKDPSPERSRADSDVRRKPVPAGAVPSLSQLQTHNATLRSVSGDSAQSNEDALFVKPTWAASSRQTSNTSVNSQRRVSPPSSSLSLSAASASSYFPKPRSPSPALMQRLQSMELERSLSAGSSSHPQKLNLKQQSVDDLRKLYEVRAGTVATLQSAVIRASRS